MLKTTLKDVAAHPGTTTKQVAERLQMSDANAGGELLTLLERGEVTRTMGKPAGAKRTVWTYTAVADAAP